MESRLRQPVSREAIDESKNWLMLREEDATFFENHPNERFYLRDLFADEKHPFLLDAENEQRGIKHPTALKVVAIRLHTPRAIVRIPVLQRKDKPTQLYISRSDNESKVFTGQPYMLADMVGKLLRGFTRTLVFRGIVFDGKCHNCGLCFRTGDMVGGDDVGSEVHLYCAYCMERRLLNGKKIDAAVIANIINDDINDEERVRAAEVINEITDKLRPLIAEYSQFYELGKFINSHTQK